MDEIVRMLRERLTQTIQDREKSQSVRLRACKHYDEYVDKENALRAMINHAEHLQAYFKED